jgi:hypothetical protein
MFIMAIIINIVPPTGVAITGITAIIKIPARDFLKAIVGVPLVVAFFVVAKGKM